MFTVTERDIATFILDFSTLVLIGGIYYYSRVFRKRGLPEDKLFFAVLIANVGVAVTDVLSYIFDEKAFPHAAEIATAGVTAYILCLTSFFLLIMQYAYAKKTANQITVKSWFRPIMIPGYLLLVLAFVNLFTGWLFSYDENATYQLGVLLLPAYIILITYMGISFGTISMVLKERNSRSVLPIWIFMMPFALGTVIVFVIYNTASLVPICLAMSLAFVNMGSLNEILGKSTNKDTEL